MVRVQANEQLCRWGWASTRAERKTESQPAEVDLVCSRDGYTLFCGVVVLNSNTSKKRVGDKIEGLQNMANIGKPFASNMNTRIGWVLLIKKAHTDEWFAVENKISYAKGSGDYKTMKEVLA